MSQRCVHEQEVYIFKEMPSALQVHLHTEVFLPRLVRHPLFDHLLSIDEPGMVEICHRATAEDSLEMDKELFICGEPANRMFFVVAGKLNYYLGATGIKPQAVKRGKYFCEMVLWLQWEHRGRMVAGQHCELVSIDAQKFRE